MINIFIGVLAFCVIAFTVTVCLLLLQGSIEIRVNANDEKVFEEENEDDEGFGL